MLIISIIPVTGYREGILTDMALDDIFIIPERAFAQVPIIVIVIVECLAQKIQTV